MPELKIKKKPIDELLTRIEDLKTWLKAEHNITHPMDCTFGFNWGYEETGVYLHDLHLTIEQYRW